MPIAPRRGGSINAGDEADLSQPLGKRLFVAKQILTDILRLVWAHVFLMERGELARKLPARGKRRSRGSDSDNDGSQKIGNGQHAGYSLNTQSAWRGIASSDGDRR
jgi:hypothetical protein